MSKFKEYNEKIDTDGIPTTRREMWLACCREMAKLTCETCQNFGHAEIDEETGEFFHDVAFEDESFCNADMIHREIASVERGE